MSFKNEIEQINQDWTNSFEQKDAKACAEFYTEKARIISSYVDQAHGQEAIEKTMQEWIEGGAINKMFSLLEFSADKDLAYSVVAYSEDYENEDGSLDTETEKAVNVYLRPTSVRAPPGHPVHNTQHN